MFHGPNYSCGLSMIWPAAAVTAVNHHQRQQQQQQHYNWDDQAQLDDVYSVDCTLSLGTPATRKSGGAGEKKGHERRSSGCLAANFCWDFLEHGGGGGGGKGMSGKSGGGRGGNGGGGGEMLLARRCANCDTTSTPLWRNGPRGPKSLCNACGIRYKKEERRATAAAAATTSSAPDHQPYHHHHTSSSSNYYNNSWNAATQYPIQTHQTIQCFPMQY